MFVDLPDPDNLVAVLGVRNLLLRPDQTPHVVLTGRPTDLGARSIPPAEVGRRLQGGEPAAPNGLFYAAKYLSKQCHAVCYTVVEEQARGCLHLHMYIAGDVAGKAN